MKNIELNEPLFLVANDWVRETHLRQYQVYLALKSIFFVHYVTTQAIQVQTRLDKHFVHAALNSIAC